MQVHSTTECCRVVYSLKSASNKFQTRIPLKPRPSNLRQLFALILSHFYPNQPACIQMGWSEWVIHNSKTKVLMDQYLEFEEPHCPIFNRNISATPSSSLLRRHKRFSGVEDTHWKSVCALIFGVLGLKFNQQKFYFRHCGTMNWSAQRRSDGNCWQPNPLSQFCSFNNDICLWRVQKNFSVMKVNKSLDDWLFPKLWFCRSATNLLVLNMKKYWMREKSWMLKIISSIAIEWLHGSLVLFLIFFIKKIKNLMFYKKKCFLIYLIFP